MQYNLDFIESGMQFPPRTEIRRIKEYFDNLNLYNGNHERVFSEYLSRIQGNEPTRTSFYTTLNYCRLLSKKTADLVCGEKPTITYPDNKATADNIKICKCIIDKKLRQSVLDFSRLGETILRVYMGKDNKPKVTIMKTIAWIPIVSEEDNSEIEYQVIAYPETINKKTYLNIQIHSDGFYENRKYNVGKIENKTYNEENQVIKYDSYTIGSLAEEPETISTGIKGFAVHNITNEATSTNIHGSSDYEMISTIIAEMEIRFAQIAKILDKHASPTIAAGLENFELDEDQSGTIRGIKLGDGLIISNDGKIPQYVTWEGQLIAAFQHISELTKQLDKLTEMGALLSDVNATGGTQGFEALQVRMVNARLKARRISQEFDEPYKEIISQLYQLLTSTELREELSVFWNDGLPNDEMRDAQIGAIKINDGVLSPTTVRINYEGMTKVDAGKEQVLIDESNPASFETNFNDEEEGIDET